MAGKEKSKLQADLEEARRLQSSYRDLLDEAKGLSTEAKAAKEAADDSAMQIAAMMGQIEDSLKSIQDTKEKIEALHNEVGKHHTAVENVSREAQNRRTASWRPF